MKTKRIIGLICCLALFLALSGCACEHEFGDWETIFPATCAAEGLQQRTCLNCGEVGERAIAQTDHVMGERKVQQPTCTSEGKEEYNCIHCGLTESVTLSRVPHTYGAWQITKTPTCLETGMQIRYCADCNTAEEMIADVVAHTYGNWKIDKRATCTEDGMQHRICSVCGEEENVSVPGGHGWSDATCTRPKTCAGCGMTEGSALGHAMGNDAKCDRCGTIEKTDMKTVLGTGNISYSYDLFFSDFSFVWQAENLSGKTITNGEFTAYFYNKAGDLKNKYSTSFTYQCAPGETMVAGFNDIVWVSDFKTAIVGDVTLQYSDGTVSTGWYGWGPGGLLVAEQNNNRLP